MAVGGAEGEDLAGSVASTSQPLSQTGRTASFSASGNCHAIEPSVDVERRQRVGLDEEQQAVAG